MLEKARRTLSEKTTSVEYPIELTQKGEVSQVIKRGVAALIIPTNIENPKLLKITPLTDHASRVLRDGWYCNMQKYYASNSSVSSLLTNSATKSASLYPFAQEALSLYNRQLYTAKTYVTSSNAASDSLYASDSLWKKESRYATDAPNFLIVTTNASKATWGNSVTSAASAAEGVEHYVTNLRFAFEVTGY